MSLQFISFLKNQKIYLGKKNIYIFWNNLTILFFFFLFKWYKLIFFIHSKLILVFLTGNDCSQSIAKAVNKHIFKNLLLILILNRLHVLTCDKIGIYFHHCNFFTHMSINVIYSSNVYLFQLTYIKNTNECIWNIICAHDG